MITATATPPGSTGDGEPEASPSWPEPVPARVIQERRQAQDPARSAAELRATMDSSEDPGARRAVLANRSCPDWIRQAAAVDDPDPDVRAAAVRTAANTSAADWWAQDAAWQVRAELARRQDTDPHLLAILALQDPDGLVRRSALGNPSIPADALQRALTGDRGLDALAAAASPGLDLSALDAYLDRIRHVAARGAIAARDDAAPAILGRLGVADPDGGIRALAVGRPRFPADLLAAALDDRDAAVRLAAITHPRLPVEALPRALDNRDPAIRAHGAAHRAADPGTVGRLAVSDPAAEVRRSACGNPACPPAALATAATADRKHSVRREAAANPGCPSSAVLAACADPDAAVRLAALRNPGATADGAFASLIAPAPRRPKAPSPAAVFHAARGPSVEAYVRAAREILAGTPWHRLRRLRLHELAGPDLQAILAPHLRLAAGHEDPVVRAAVAAHADVSAAVLAILAADPDPAVRSAAAARLLDAVAPRATPE